MKNVFRVVVALAVVTALTMTIASAAFAAARTNTAPKTATTPPRVGTGPGAITIDSRQVNLKVTAVNPTARTITLQMPNGTTMTYKASRDVRNLNQIKRGDTVRATVIDTLAVYVQKQGTRPTVSETQTVTLSPRGRPGTAVSSNTIRMTARVQSVNMQNRTVTVMGPDNRSRTIKVGSNVDLRGLKAGDTIVLRHTEAMVLSLQRTAAS